VARNRELEERVRNLRAIAEEHLPQSTDEREEIREMREVFARLICDRCGLVVRISAHPERMPIDPSIEEWGHGPEGDLCPSCAAS
jgi:rubredoxin